MNKQIVNHHTQPGQSETHEGLEYPFGLRWSPPIGEPFEVVDGVYWLRTPLPMALDHINLWLLRDGDHWTIVDTGYDHESSKAVWRQVFENFLDPKSVSRIIVTHYHPDHIGLAAWLSRQCDSEVFISRGEFATYRAMIDRDQKLFADQISAFTKELGFESEHSQRYLQFMNSEDKPAESRLQKEQSFFIQAGDTFSIGDREWQVVHGNGHSPEHSCLFCPELDALISGDQAIARISSNISVYPATRNDNPLKDWLASCASLKETIPSQTMILPAHQEPFYGIDVRMQQLIDGHHQQLQLLIQKLEAAAPQAISVTTARQVLFNRELSFVESLFATGEALAHLNYLVDEQSATAEHDQNGVVWFKRSSVD